MNILIYLNITHKNGCYHELSRSTRRVVSGNNKIGTVKSVATTGVSVYSQKKEGHWGLKATTSYPRIYGSIGIICLSTKWQARNPPAKTTRWQGAQLLGIFFRRANLLNIYWYTQQPVWNLQQHQHQSSLNLQKPSGVSVQSQDAMTSSHGMPFREHSCRNFQEASSDPQRVQLHTMAPAENSLDHWDIRSAINKTLVDCCWSRKWGIATQHIFASLNRERWRIGWWSWYMTLEPG